MEDVNDTIISTPATTDALDEDLVLDLREVTLVRDGRTLLHPVTWQGEVDERWIIIGPTRGQDVAVDHRRRPRVRAPAVPGSSVRRWDAPTWELRTAVACPRQRCPTRFPAMSGYWTWSFQPATTSWVIGGGLIRRRGPCDGDPGADEALHLGDRVWGTLSEGERKRVSSPGR